jgi:hypothetical protein
MRYASMDFHTSPLIPDIGAHFDPQKFASTVKKNTTIRQSFTNFSTVIASGKSLPPNEMPSSEWRRWWYISDVAGRLANNIAIATQTINTIPPAQGA